MKKFERKYSADSKYVYIQNIYIYVYTEYEYVL